MVNYSICTTNGRERQFRRIIPPLRLVEVRITGADVAVVVLVVVVVVVVVYKRDTNEGRELTSLHIKPGGKANPKFWRYT